VIWQGWYRPNKHGSWRSLASGPSYEAALDMAAVLSAGLPRGELLVVPAARNPNRQAHGCGCSGLVRPENARCDR
jgi:hypothetical protein